MRLAGLLVLAAAVVAAAAEPRFFVAGDGTLDIASKPLGEHVTVRYRRDDGTYDYEAMERIRHILRCRGDGVGQKETRIVVRHDDGRVSRERFQQAASVIALPFDVGVIQRGRSRKAGGVVGHAVEHELMQPVRGPRIVHAQRLENDERFAKKAGPGDGAIECEVEGRPSRGNHPVNNERRVRLN